MIDDNYTVQEEGESTEFDSHEVQNSIYNSKLMLMSLAAVPVL